MRHPVDCTNRRWQVLLRDAPDRLEVDLEVVMHKHVAKASDSTLRHFGLGSLEAVTEPLRRFRDGLQIAYYGFLH